MAAPMVTFRIFWLLMSIPSVWGNSIRFLLRGRGSTCGGEVWMAQTATPSHRMCEQCVLGEGALRNGDGCGSSEGRQRCFATDKFSVEFGIDRESEVSPCSASQFDLDRAVDVACRSDD